MLVSVKSLVLSATLQNNGVGGARSREIQELREIENNRIEGGYRDHRRRHCLGQEAHLAEDMIEGQSDGSCKTMNRNFYRVSMVESPCRSLKTSKNTI